MKLTRRSLLSAILGTPAVAKAKPARVFWSIKNRYHAPVIPWVPYGPNERDYLRELQTRVNRVKANLCDITDHCPGPATVFFGNRTVKTK